MDTGEAHCAQIYFHRFLNCTNIRVQLQTDFFFRFIVSVFFLCWMDRDVQPIWKMWYVRFFGLLALRKFEICDFYDKKN